MREWAHGLMDGPPLHVTGRVFALIEALHAGAVEDQAALYREYGAEILE